MRFLERRDNMTKKFEPKTLCELKVRINKMNPVDIATAFMTIKNEELVTWVKLLDKNLLADSFAELPAMKKSHVIAMLSEERIVSLVQELDEDELVDTLQELPANMVRSFMRYIETDERREIINILLGYPQESVGSVMSVNFLSIKNTLTAKEALDIIVTSELDADKLELIYMTDCTLSLVGYVYLADIIRHPIADKLDQIMHPIHSSVFATDDQEIVAKLSYKYDVSEIPVTDSEGRLIGIVPVEMAIDIMHEEYDEDLANIHGIQEIESDDYWEKSSYQISKDRAMWLIICLITATLTGFIINRYEAILASNVILTAYIPMLMDSGGNAGSQSSTTLIRVLYSSKIHFRKFLHVIWKEFKIGIMVGLVLVLVNMVRMFALDGVSIWVNLTVSITLLFTIILSKIIGATLPIVADRLKIDPTVMAGPLITTIVDSSVLVIYFEIASILIGV